MRVEIWVGEDLCVVSKMVEGREMAVFWDER